MGFWLEVAYFVTQQFQLIVGFRYATLKILRGSVPSITRQNCLLCQYCEPSTAVSLQNGVGHQGQIWFSGDHCLKLVSPGFEIS